MLLFVLALLLTGCFGSKPSPKGPGSPGPGSGPAPTKVEGQVFGPADLTTITASSTDRGEPTLSATSANDTELTWLATPATDRQPVSLTGTAGDAMWAALRDRFSNAKVSAAGASIEGETPLANTTVLVYDLEQYLNQGGGKAVAEVTTNNQGKFSATGVPPGKDLLLLVQTKPRLSAIIPASAAQGKNANVNSATTLAAELWAPTLKEQGVANVPWDLATFLTETIAEATFALNALGDGRVLAALQFLVPDKFGTGLPSGADAGGEFTDLADRLTGTLPQGPAACWMLELDGDWGIPASRISVKGIAPDWLDEHVFARFEVGGVDEWVPVFIELSGGGEADLYMPIHPVHHLNGGVGQLIIYNQPGNDAEAIECEPFSVTVNPISKQPGTLDDMLQDVEESLLVFADVLNLNRTGLLNSTPDWGGSPFEAMLAANMQLLSGDDPNSVREVLEKKKFTVAGTTYEFAQDGIELVEALLAATGVADELRQLSTALQDAFDEAALPPSAGMPSGMGMTHMAMNTSGQGFIVPPNMIKTPRQLGYWMDVQNACASVNGPIREGIRDIAGIALAGVTVVVPPAAAVTGPIGLTLTLTQLMYDMCENLLPSELDRIDLLVTPDGAYNEDFEGPVQWEAQLHVADRDWLLDVPAVVGLVPGAGKFGKFISKAKTAKLASLGGEAAQAANRINAHSEAFADWVQTTVSTLWDLEVGKRFNGPEVRPIEVDPNREFEHAYFKWNIREEAEPKPFAVDQNVRLIVPKRAGQATFFVETNPDLFLSQKVIAERLLEIKAIEIEIVSALSEDALDITINQPFRVDPSEHVIVLAAVHNATDTKVEWKDLSGKGTFLHMSDQLTYYLAPEEQGRYTIQATSIAKTGPRSAVNNPPVRRATATVIVGENPTVFPKPACMQVGDTHQFYSYPSSEFADANGFFGGNQPRGLGDVWAEIVGGRSSGTLTSDGLFRATRTGTVTIKFWLEDSDWSDTVTFEVEEECEGVYVSLAGHDTINYEHACAAYDVDDPHMVPLLSFGQWDPYDHTTAGNFHMLDYPNLIPNLRSGNEEYVEMDVWGWGVGSPSGTYDGFVSGQNIYLPGIGATLFGGPPGKLAMWGKYVPTPNGRGEEFAVTGTLEGLGSTLLRDEWGNPDRMIFSFAKVWFYNVKDIRGSGCRNAMPNHN